MERGINEMYGRDLEERKAYITGRLESQIAYYDGKSKRNKKMYYTMSIVSIVVNAMIPILSLYLKTPDTIVKLGITCLSSLTAVLTSCLMVFNSKELWLKYRKNAARLESMLYQFYAGAGIFEDMDGESAFRLLVRRCEDEMTEENENWSRLFVKETKSSGEKGV